MVAVTKVYSDFCGEEVGAMALGGYHSYTVNKEDYTMFDLDLCPACVGKLHDFIDQNINKPK